MTDLVKAQTAKSCLDDQHDSLYLGIGEGFKREASQG